MRSKNILLLAGVLLLFSCPIAAALEKVEPLEEVRMTTAEVDVVGIRDDTIVGRITNKSDVPLEDVRLLVRHIWLWDNEYRPGFDTYSVAEYLPIKGIISPGESIEFNFTPILISAKGGRFATKIIVAEFTEVPAFTALR